MEYVNRISRGEMRKSTPLPRLFTSQRAIRTSPSPLRAAMLQKNTQVKQIRTQKAALTNNQFIEELEEMIAAQLQECPSDLDQFRVYQGAFDTWIQKYEKHAKILYRVKNGYDEIIEKLRAEVIAHRKAHRIVEQSMSSLHNELQIKSDKTDAKRRKFNEVDKDASEVIVVLREDIEELAKQVQEERIERTYLDASIAQDQFNMEIFNGRLEKTIKKFERRQEALKTNSDVIVALNGKLDECKVALGDVLDSILAKKNGIKQAEARIRELEWLIQRDRRETTAKISETDVCRKEVAKAAVAKEQIDHEMEQSIEDASSLCMMLRIGCDNMKVAEKFVRQASEDPVLLLALYLSRRNGYENGIDPDLFPEFVNHIR